MAEIVIETWDIGKHRNAYRGERALVCAVIEDVLEEIQTARRAAGKPFLGGKNEGQRLCL